MRRVVFLDYLRVAAIFLVLLVHCCEPFYLCDAGLYIASRTEAGWLVALDALGRAAVPLFVMASAYLLFPLSDTLSATAFLKRRLVRVGVPFALWCVIYNAVNGGAWGRMLFNFPEATGGHLWFVPMLAGLYLLMPLLTPWANQASERTLRRFLGVWLFTTFFPYLRALWGAVYGAPSYGAVPYLYGECPWNGFGTFQYVSGFIGYMLLGFYFRKFAPVLSWPATLRRAVPAFCAGWLFTAVPFFLRLGAFPYAAPYARAVELEASWEFCSFGVMLTVYAYFLVLRKCTFAGWGYGHIIRPLAEASYGIYLLHILILVPVVAFLRGVWPAPAVMLLGSCAVFLLSACASLALRRIPVVGRCLTGL